MVSWIDILIEKKIEKIQSFFDIENWLWKSKFGTFQQVCESSGVQIFCRSDLG